MTELAVRVPEVVEGELNAGLVGLHVAINALIPVDESSEFSERLFVAGKLCWEPVKLVTFAATSGDLALGAADAGGQSLDLFARLLVFR